MSAERPCVIRETGSGQYLAAYDPDAHQGRGSVEWTIDPALAMVFESGASAAATWRLPSATQPYRDDGKPNRPLSAFTITIEPAP